MGNRHLKPVAIFAKSAVLPNRMGNLPTWALLSLLTNSFLLVFVVLILFRTSDPSTAVATRPDTRHRETASNFLAIAATPAPELGPRHQLTYQQWVNLLRQEASAAADNRPPRLTILLGDSLSLWFPTELLWTERSWLNQGISGETSAGLQKRLNLIHKTDPETIFLMIGINDLIRGVDDATLLKNQRQIVQALQDKHPNAQIVVQSILPHGGPKATWEGRDRLLVVSNDRIKHLNLELKAIADEFDAYFLDLYPLFTDADGYLRSELSTDGLHLSSQGYLVWRSALYLYSQMQLEPDL